jgi:trans-aconitate methyltransferase
VTVDDPADDVHRLADQWERNAVEDPLWVILSDPRRGGRRWSVDEFFATGDVEWRRVRELLGRVGAAPNLDGRFIDFGCGVGRITRQLAQDFRSGIGIDVSETMIRTARGLNPELDFVVNRAPDLSDVPDQSAAFVYSHIVLQHMVPEMQLGFIREFLRVLAPHGVAAFQVAGEFLDTGRPIVQRAAGQLPRPVKTALKRLVRRPTVSNRIEMDMHLLPDAVIQPLVRAGGGLIVAAPYTNSADRDHNGAIRFFDRPEAVNRHNLEPRASPILSRFYIVRRS